MEEKKMKEIKVYKPQYVYILLCEDGSYYTGYSTDPERRFREHLSGKGAKYTRAHKPKELLYIERYVTRSEAMQREAQIKRFTHEQKKQLMLDNKQNLMSYRKQRVAETFLDHSIFSSRSVPII